jgi:hypothetical protein
MDDEIQGLGQMLPSSKEASAMDKRGSREIPKPGLTCSSKLEFVLALGTCLVTL